MSEIIVGIDLGTTNSEIAVVRDGRIELINIDSDANARPILPSVVGLDDQGALLVGAPARNQYVLHPERTVRSIKRRMGEAVQITFGDRQCTPPEISAMILMRLKRIAEAHLACPVRKAVITVPAYFSDAQRQATREAGEIAGLEVVRILNEPTAAALAYGAHRGAEGRRVARKSLVYDLGGGTFDVSIVNMEGDVVEVLASHGDNQLGGDDFDQCLIDMILEYIVQEHGVEAAVVKSTPVAMARLQRSAEAAKIQLSDRPYSQVTEEFLLEIDGVPLHVSLEISRDDYEARIAPYIAKTMDAVHVALRGAGLAVSAIDEVLLVGGATRTPLVVRQLETLTGMQPHGEIDPDLCVAMGAAVQAEIIAGGGVPTVLIDVTPYTFGTSTYGTLNGREYPFCFIPLIRRNSPIPAAHSEVFYTMVDNQASVDIRVFQGESPDAMDNIEIGQFRIDGLRKVPANNPIVIDFSIDINGILNVRASEKVTGLACAITIDNALSRIEDSQLDAARDRVRSMFGDDDEAGSYAQPLVGSGSPAQSQSQRQLLTEGSALIEKAQRLLATANSDDRDDLIDAIETLRDAMSLDGAGAVTSEKELGDALGALADVVYFLDN